MSSGVNSTGASATSGKPYIESGMDDASPTHPPWKWYTLVSQTQLDHERRTYQLSFPGELKEVDALNWIRQISGGLRTHSTLTSTPSIAIETLSTPESITHYLIIPWRDADYVVAQLHALVPGMSVTPVTTGRPFYEWTFAEEFDLFRPQEAVVIPDTQAFASSLLHTSRDLAGDERVLAQWILSPMPRQSLTDEQLRSTDFDWQRLRYGGDHLDKATIAARRAKLSEPNFMACFRVASYANTESRAIHLVANAFQPVRTLGRFNRATVWRRSKLIEATAHCLTPRKFGVQVSANELVPFLMWPFGNQLVPGLPRGATRHMLAPDSVPREGRIFGTTTTPGRERRVAMDYTSALTHTFIGGGTGVGKTTVMANMARQDMEAGKGVIVIEPKGDLFHEVLDNVPRARWADVIVIDFTDGMKPVGFNILDQGNPRTVVDELTELFQYKYDDKGVWFRELMFHGLLTLSRVPGMTFNDIRPLVAPKDPVEQSWAKSVTDAVKDRELVHFWKRWWALPDQERVRNSQSLENRVWQLISRIEPRYLFGQSTSSFKMDDVLRDNKILLVNLAGVPKESKEIVGTLLFNAIWQSAQNVPASNENFVYLDEFQMFADIPMGLDDVLALARKYKFGVVAATQYVERLPAHLQLAVKANMRSKIIMQSSEQSAKIWSGEFGSNRVLPSDIANLGAYKAVARVNTEAGISSPFTITTLPPPKPYGTKWDVARLSREQYGRSVAEIDAQEATRRDSPLGRRKVSDAPIERVSRRKISN